MALSSHPNHPGNRAYVLKLHWEARPDAAHLRGRLENIATGHWVEFTSAQQLFDYLVHDIRAAHPTPSSQDEAES